MICCGWFASEGVPCVQVAVCAIYVTADVAVPACEEHAVGTRLEF